MNSRTELETRAAELDGEIVRLQAELNTIALSLGVLNDEDVTAKYGVKEGDQIKAAFTMVAYLRELGWSESDIDTWVNKRQLYINLAGDLDSCTIAAHDLPGRPYSYLPNVPIVIVMHGRRMWLADNA